MTKDELIEKHRDINVDHEWWDTTYDDFVERLKEAGLTVLKEDVHFSGFWSQGDGACFAMVARNLQRLHEAACAWLDTHRKHYVATNEAGEEVLCGGKVIEAIDTWCQYLVTTFLPYQLNARMKAVLEETFIHVETSGRYCHPGTMSLEHEARLDDDEGVAILDAIDFKHLESLLRGLADALYRVLEEEHTYQTTDEAVWEAIEANELDAELDEDEEAVPTHEENDPCCN